jgi:NTP pyrophosphatase (non-canonical NTP hydrolase)
VKPDTIQRRVLQTWYEESNDLYYDLMPSILGLVGEAGELADLHKKHVFKPGCSIERERYIDELGDVLFYLAVIAHQLGLTLDELSRQNHRKLIERSLNGMGYNRGRERDA